MDNNIKEWLFNLNCLYNNILKAQQSHKDLYLYNIVEDLRDNVDVVFVCYILVSTNSMIDEWNLNIGSEVNNVRKICKPIFKYLKKTWPDLKIFRNTILTHNHRNKENKSVHFTTKGFNYTVPMDNVEITLLVALLGLVTDVVNKIYNFDFFTMASQLPEEEFNYNPISLEDAKKAHDLIVKQMNDLLRSA